jgi:hypothetical protein
MGPLTGTFIWSQTGRNFLFSAFILSVSVSPGKTIFLFTVEWHFIPNRLILVHSFAPKTNPKARRDKTMRSLWPCNKAIKRSTPTKNCISGITRIVGTPRSCPSTLISLFGRNRYRYLMDDLFQELLWSFSPQTFFFLNNEPVSKNREY